MTGNVDHPPNQAASAAPSAEIAGLDPRRDYERIVFLLSYQLFQWDVERSLEFALLNAYAIPSISGLLARTGEFTRRARKRYDDTELLLAEIGENGFGSERAGQALERINEMHGRFRIANDDYLYVLSTFVFNPIDWMAEYRRPFTAKEQPAWLHYYRELGRRMGIENIPETLGAFGSFRERYEAERMVHASSNKEVSASRSTWCSACLCRACCFRWPGRWQWRCAATVWSLPSARTRHRAGCVL
jgi:hypothetical protein